VQCPADEISDSIASSWTSPATRLPFLAGLYLLDDRAAHVNARVTLQSPQEHLRVATTGVEMETVWRLYAVGKVRKFLI
jgi:hypothetical protein